MKKLVLVLSLLFPTLAGSEELAGIGKVALNVLEPVGVVNDFLGSACLILGISFLFGSLIKYMQYRVNPLAAPLSTVVTLLVVGLVFLGLPFVYLITENGIPFLLFR